MSAVLGRLPRVELGVADGFAGKRVDVDESAESTEGVFENRRGQSTRRADDEQTGFVSFIGFAILGNW